MRRSATMLHAASAVLALSMAGGVRIADEPVVVGSRPAPPPAPPPPPKPSAAAQAVEILAPAAAPAPLTPRDEERLRLAAQKRDRQIARQQKGMRHG